MERSTRRSANGNKDVNNNKNTSNRRRRRDDTVDGTVNESQCGEEEVEEDDEGAIDRKRANEKDNAVNQIEQGDADEDQDDDDEEENRSVTETTTRRTSSRRERSQSVVSTTSDCSSIVSESIEEGREHLYEEKLQELLTKKKMIEEGTLAEYCRRITEYKEERNHLLQTAQWHKTLQMKNIKDLYGFEVQRAHHLWEDAKQKLQQEMLRSNQVLREKLHQELQFLRANQSVNMNKKRSPSLELIKERTRKQLKIQNDKSINLIPTNVLYLPLDTITCDLKEIAQGLHQTVNQLQSGLETPRLEIAIEQRRLICGKYVFEEGDEVVMTSTVLKKDFVGIITSVDTHELYVKLSTTNQKVCVSMEQIATKRCEIRPFLRGTVGIESYQSTGWVECEPF